MLAHKAPNKTGPLPGGQRTLDNYFVSDIAVRSSSLNDVAIG
jgi:hypothetical protein